MDRHSVDADHINISILMLDKDWHCNDADPYANPIKIYILLQCQPTKVFLFSSMECVMMYFDKHDEVF